MIYHSLFRVSIIMFYSAVGFQIIHTVCSTFPQIITERLIYKVLKIQDTMSENKRAEWRGATMMNNNQPLIPKDRKL